jgi:PTH1 family peptidyl-tRNA hydrolase
MGQFRRVPAAKEAKGNVGGTTVFVLKPQTYMNRSGQALAPFRDRSGFDPSQHLLVLSDDFALPVGKFRLRGAGSAGGHNGLKSIEGALRRQDYARLRIGVGPLPVGMRDTADFVLDRFPKADWNDFQALLDPMAEAVESWIKDGIEVAMNKFNAK